MNAEIQKTYVLILNHVNFSYVINSVEEQLPNVVSSFHNRPASNALTSPKVSWGATFRFRNGFSGEMQITGETTDITGVNAVTPGLHVYDRITLNLAQGNSIYAGSNVQPMSLTVNFYIRYQ